MGAVYENVLKYKGLNKLMLAFDYSAFSFLSFAQHLDFLYFITE